MIYHLRHMKKNLVFELTTSSHYLALEEKTMTNITLSNNNLSLEIDQQKGALLRMQAAKTGWRILDRPHLGLSFRLLLPLSEERRNNPVHGEKQTCSSIVVDPDRKGITITWDNLQSEYGGTHDIKLVATINLTDESVIWGMTIDNDSNCMIENIYYPYLGDVQPPLSAKWLKTFLYNYATAQEWSLWPTYDNLRGYYGVDFPTQVSPTGPACGTPMSPFILLRGKTQGLYVGACSPSSELVAWHTELRPGYGNSINSQVPETDNIAGKDISIRFAPVHVSYIHPGERRALTPIMMQAFQGDWHMGVDIYKTWRNTWFQMPALPEWTRQPQPWQQIHINSPEDELRIQFRELVNIGKECAEHGVKAIQLVGWNDGGQDQGNPSHDPDPRLGTFADLQQAIRNIQNQGVKVILFSKFTWADRATQRFRDELIRLSAKDPYGDYYHYHGYQYQTITQLLDINTKRLVPMCFLSEEYLQVCEDEFKKILDLGADGMLFDECLHHSPALLCFDTSHGHRYGAPIYANDRELIRRFIKLSNPVNSEFLYAGEACYDWELETYQLSYHRSEKRTHIPLSRYMLPEAALMTAVTGFNDRNMINQCLLYRYIISYEPFNFKGRLNDFPLTLEYGKKMDALRTELREYFWDGVFQDTQGAKVTVNNRRHHPYTVYRNKKNGHYGIVIANYKEKRSINARIKITNDRLSMQYRSIDDPEWHPADNGLHIPPCSAVVVVPR